MIEPFHHHQYRQASERKQHGGEARAPGWGRRVQIAEGGGNRVAIPSRRRREETE
jgi:hypothetical protein